MAVRRPPVTRPLVGVRPPDPDRIGVSIARAARWYAQAFERLYMETAGVAFGLAFRMVRDGSTAEEVTREDLAESWQYASRCAPACDALTGYGVRRCARRSARAARIERDHGLGLAAGAGEPARMRTRSRVGRAACG